MIPVHPIKDQSMDAGAGSVAHIGFDCIVGAFICGRERAGPPTGIAHQDLVLTVDISSESIPSVTREPATLRIAEVVIVRQRREVSVFPRAIQGRYTVTGEVEVTSAVRLNQAGSCARAEIPGSAVADLVSALLASTGWRVRTQKSVSASETRKISNRHRPGHLRLSMENGGKLTGHRRCGSGDGHRLNHRRGKGAARSTTASALASTN